MMREKIGLIGGSGFYNLTAEKQLVREVSTPFGDAKVIFGLIEGKEVVFIPRHGGNHSIPPHKVNYQANIYALYKSKVDRIISSSAVGSILPTIQPGTFVIPDQFIDFTIGRPKTFFDGKFDVKLHTGKTIGGVVHTDMTDPYCVNLRTTIIEQAKKLSLPFVSEGVYVCTEGPRFETPAEINAFKTLGGTLVGMTSVSECVLARELGMCYSTICLVTNFAAGLQERITATEVYSAFDYNLPKLQLLVKQTIANCDFTQDFCSCNHHMS